MIWMVWIARFIVWLARAVRVLKPKRNRLTRSAGFTYLDGMAVCSNCLDLSRTALYHACKWCGGNVDSTCVIINYYPSVWPPPFKYPITCHDCHRGEL